MIFNLIIVPYYEFFPQKKETEDLVAFPEEILNKKLVFFAVFNPFSANPTNGQTHSDNSSAVADEPFECVWPF